MESRLGAHFDHSHAAFHDPTFIIFAQYEANEVVPFCFDFIYSFNKQAPGTYAFPDTALGVGVAKILFLGVRHCNDRHRKPKITLEGSSVLEYSEVR